MVQLMRRVITLHNKKTCMRLTDSEWSILDKVCKNEKIKRKILLELICKNHSAKLNLTSALRLFMLLYLFEKTKQFDFQNDGISVSLPAILNRLN